MKSGFFLGIDGGGTKCRARLEDAAGNLLAESVAGPANPTRDFAQTIASIEQATYDALSQAGLSSTHINQIHAGIGLAGINLPSYRRKMENWDHPFASMHLATDLHIACLGAHNGADGAIVIVGTGSSGVLIQGQQQTEVGGHGYNIGDKSSGAWFGNQAIRHTLEVLDGLLPPSLLSQKICATTGCDNPSQLVEKYIHGQPVAFAQLAPLLFESAAHNDDVAMDIILDGAGYLSRLAGALLDRGADKIAFIGGLAPSVVPFLNQRVQQHLHQPQFPPEYGAILFCRSQHNRDHHE